MGWDVVVWCAAVCGSWCGVEWWWWSRSNERSERRLAVVFLPSPPSQFSSPQKIRTMTATTTTTPALVPSENILSAKVSHSCHPSHVQCTR